MKKGNIRHNEGKRWAQKQGMASRERDRARAWVTPTSFQTGSLILFSSCIGVHTSYISSSLFSLSKILTNKAPLHLRFFMSLACLNFRFYCSILFCIFCFGKIFDCGMSTILIFFSAVKRICGPILSNHG